jgi:hypothetical protein
MRMLRSADGAAMVTALMLTMLALVISMGLIYSVTNGARISASQKRYRSALAAAHGGVELLTLEIMPRLFQTGVTQAGIKGDFSLLNMQLPQYDCLQQKLKTPSADWNLCSAAQVSADPAEMPDLAFTLSGSSQEKGFSVTAKIVDTVPGNSDNGAADYLDVGLSVAGKDEVVHPQHVPGIYHLSVQGVRDGASNREKARLSVLYAY